MALEILDWHDPDLLAAPVLAALEGLVDAGVPEEKIIGVTLNTDEESDTDLWCPRYGIPFESTGNVVIVHTHKTRKAPPEFAAALVTADTRADLNGVVKHTLEVSKVSFAPIDAAVEATGMESGGMSPIGLPADWPLLVDQHILAVPQLYVGSGIRPSKLVVSGSIFADIPGVRFVSMLGKPRN
ncbi:YbaK/prolyl-tRNA synthetase associated region [Bifidobacterium sp. DSM 109958]|uniref:YbaK/prolyl-tRNA synthetase associated region n=1 Tax=Bifidobacterium moraviense TaxID=2675323 RepID=A0A7Y0F091_9BIFI|nr:YbaK/EbsC family protein [Bifidobacterium sp. DSM 109958]NMM99433.1 YbaK/prolyl-tRNA synthetase associated region [Bifidobacterium sp. DSM 109958]